MAAARRRVNAFVAHEHRRSVCAKAEARQPKTWRGGASISALMSSMGTVWRSSFQQLLLRVLMCAGLLTITHR
ncbi:MAG: hypothetical protein ACLSWY_09085 [Ruthenibacterium lactatiformans]